MKTFEELPTDLFQNGFDTNDKTPLSKERVQKVADWISTRFEKSTRLYKIDSSYSIKHIVEKNMGEYIANGELIAAMILIGFKYQRIPASPNVYFYVKNKF